MQVMKLEFIEKGRLSNGEMMGTLGGKTYQNCSDAGPGICPSVSGNAFTIIANCAHNLYTCDTAMRFCMGNTDLAVCSGLPSDDKGVKRSTGGTSAAGSVSVAETAGLL